MTWGHVVVRESYAGDLSVKESWDLLAREKGAVLVDCRSEAEWSFVGTPDLSSLGSKPVFVAWQTFPGMKPNLGFVDQVRAAGVMPEQAVLFLCRSGGRSKSAAMAMTAVGYGRCYNVAGGFEGGHDEARHRGRRDGWKASGLPWTQE
jgi:rhodanese-related sulfurtransferase